MEPRKSGEIQEQEEILKMISWGGQALAGGREITFATAVVVLLLKEEFSSWDCQLLGLILKIPMEEVLPGVIDRT